MTPEQRAKRLAELMDEHRLFDRGTRRVYRGKHLTGISLPVGGIAAGPIQINGEARRHIWQIFRNYPPVTLPNSFFAVRAQAGKSDPVVRVLQTVGEGTFAPMKALSFSGEYPFGWYTFEEPALPVQVTHGGVQSVDSAEHEGLQHPVRDFQSDGGEYRTRAGQRQFPGDAAESDRLPEWHAVEGACRRDVRRQHQSRVARCRTASWCI